jgi:polysaccharide biosynthesis transport protein
LLRMVSATPSTDSNTIKVEVMGSDPEQTALVANEFAQQTIALRQESQRAAVVTARQALATQIALMTEAERASDHGQVLQTRIEQLTILEGLQNGGYVLWQPAQTPQAPVSPKPFRDAGAGLAVGLVFGLILAVGSDRIDRRLKEQGDFEREFGLPILALVPKNGRRWERSDHNTGFVGFADRASPSAESYRLLRSNLQYFDVENGLRTILITSALPNEAKTVSSINLALSLAMSGARVVLIDSDLRNPRMQDYLHLDNSVGLSNVLAGTVSVQNAVKKVKTADFLPPGAGAAAGPDDKDSPLHRDFLCLTSGPLPPNPAELLASKRFAETLSTLKNMAEHILIDSVPVMVFADAVSIASRVDGVIIVSRAGSATIDQAREVRGALERVGARSIGVVISGVKPPSSRAYGYAHQAYYRKST